MSSRYLTALVVRVALVTLGCSACAAPFQRAIPGKRLTSPDRVAPSSLAQLARPSVGVAFGGGSARGIAHVGVIRWLEEHRIPIDVAAGTSMGGLIGGAFATGMDAAELETFIASLDWDQLFGASSFAYKNIRRKADARAYPSRLEFGLRGGIVPPTALNNGEYVELLLGRIAAPYFDVEDFDDLPTPFRTVAVDLLSAQPVVMRSGSLADAMRATMSLPLIFPPVELDGQVLIDGGTMNNVPADVVKAMGADRVDRRSTSAISPIAKASATRCSASPGNTLDAMMRASTRRALAAADVVINVPLEEYGSLDWRRAAELIEEGLPRRRGDARRAAAARGERGGVRGVAARPAGAPAHRAARAGVHRARRLRHRRREAPDARCSPGTSARRSTSTPLEQDIAIVAGLDRYETVTWRLVHDGARGVGLRVQGRVKPYAPPFMMLGVNLENTTSSDFRITRDRALSRLRRRAAPARSCASTARSARTRASASSCIGRSARRRCSSRRMPASAARRST